MYQGPNMSANERLTIQALKDHDKVHPKFKATGGGPTQKEGSRVSGGGTSRRSHPSGDVASQKSSDGNKNGRPPKINFFRLVVATRAWHRLAKNSRTRLENASKPTIRLENTYKLEPDDGRHFSVTRVEDMLRETLEKKLSSVKYSAEKCRLLTTELTADIKAKVKAMEFPRYKIVCNVFISEHKAQGLEIASRCIWNKDTDNYASVTYRNPTLIAVANVYGVYFE